MKETQKARRKYVYLILNEDSEAIKIGVSIQPEVRYRQMQRANAARLYLLATIEGDESLERELHGAFDDECIHHEWFTTNVELLLAGIQIRILTETKNVARHILDRIEHRDYYAAEKFVQDLIAIQDVCIKSQVRSLLNRKQEKNWQVSVVDLDSIEERATDEVGTLRLT